MLGLKAHYNVNFSYYLQPVGSDSWAVPEYVEMVCLGISTLPPGMPTLWPELEVLRLVSQMFSQSSSEIVVLDSFSHFDLI